MISKKAWKDKTYDKPKETSKEEYAIEHKPPHETRFFKITITNQGIDRNSKRHGAWSMLSTSVMKRPYIVNSPISKGITFHSVSGSDIALPHYVNFYRYVTPHFLSMRYVRGFWPSITPSTLQMRHGSFPLSPEPWAPRTISECCMYCDAEPCNNILCHEESGYTVDWRRALKSPSGK